MHLITKAVYPVLCTLLCLLAIQPKAQQKTDNKPFVLVLGTAQDGGYPHIGCERACCKKVYTGQAPAGKTTALALVDPLRKKWWLFEAGPDLPYQLHYFAETTDHVYPFLPEGIFITHAHIGHYTGLMYLGREALGASSVKVHVLPRMKSYLSSNGPWSQLVQLKNIILEEISETDLLQLNETIQVQAFTVPHRDEYSETAGFNIITPNDRYLFIPDIDKWSRFSKDIRTLVDSATHSFLDASFYSMEEMKHRNLAEIPHPLVTETMELFSKHPLSTKNKIHFIHFNHTNRLLWDEESVKQLQRQGFGVSKIGEQY